jgi:hypothetical protein
MICTSKQSSRQLRRGSCRRLEIVHFPIPHLRERDHQGQTSKDGLETVLP